MDYGGGYSTTSYSATGGPTGGGFTTGGSQGGSQSNTAGKGTYGKDTLRPLTIHQLLSAHQPHPDADSTVDGTEITQITCVGQIRNISTQSTNITYKLDDGTGTIEVKVWIDSDPSDDDAGFGGGAIGGGGQKGEGGAKKKLEEGEWARVWGRLRHFANKRHVGAHVIRPITDKNEIAYHLLEATYVHLYFTRGALDTLSSDASKIPTNGVASNGNSNQMPMDTDGGPKLPNLSLTARKVFQCLRTSPQSNEGLHMQHVAAQTGMDVQEVYRGGDELLGHGLIFTTVDDNTWAVLEC